MNNGDKPQVKKQRKNIIDSCLLESFEPKWALNQVLLIDGVQEININTYKACLHSNSLFHVLKESLKEQGDAVCHFHATYPSRLEEMLYFAHFGKPRQLEVETVGELLTVAEEFQSSSLAAAVHFFVKSKLALDTVLKLWMQVFHFQDTQIHKDVKSFLLKNFMDATIRLSPTLLHLDAVALKLILEDDRLNITSEDYLVEPVRTWLQYRSRDITEYQVNELVSSIRLGRLSHQALEDLENCSVMNGSMEISEMIQKAKRCSIRRSMHLRDLDNHKRLSKARLPQEVILVVGGYYSDSVGAAVDVKMFDPRSNGWRRLPEERQLQRGRMSFGMVTLEYNRIYIIGGEEQHEHMGRVMCSTTFCLDAREENPTWKSKAAMHHNRRDLATVVLNGDIYAMGGDNNENIFNAVEKYEESTNRWIEIEPMIIQRAAAGAAVLQDKIYICGGYTEIQLESMTHTVERYDSVSKEWTLITGMNQMRYFLSAVAVDDSRIIVIGGGEEEEISSVEEFNSENMTWSLRSRLQYSRGDFAATILENELYVIGGGDDIRCTESVEVLDLNQMDAVWQVGTPLPHSLWAHRACCIKDVDLIQRLLKTPSTDL